jgi:hypothetical protein
MLSNNIEENYSIFLLCRRLMASEEEKINAFLVGQMATSSQPLFVDHGFGLIGGAFSSTEKTVINVVSRKSE